MTKKIKLLRVTTVPVSLNILLKGQLRFLSQFFNVVGVSASGAEIKEIEEREGVPVRVVDMEREIAPVQDMRSLVTLFQLFRKEKPEIVHANTPKGSLLSMIAAKLTGVPVRIYTVTGLRFEGFPPSAKRTLLIGMERITCAMATHVIPEGSGVQATLTEYGITRKPLRVVAHGNINGVDLDFFSLQHFTSDGLEALKKQWNIHPGDFVFCFVGRLVTDKGITELVTAFIRLLAEQPRVRLLLVGPIENKGSALPDTVKALIDDTSAIITTGFVADVRPYFAMADVFVFPSYREGFPNVVLQAGAMELPCIVTDINGSNEIIEEGKNGFIVPVQDPESLYQVMRRVVTERRLLQQLRIKSRITVAEHYEQSMVWQALLERYNEYLCEKKIINRK